MAVADIVINFSLTALIYAANLLIGLALCYMKTTKRTTIVFLSQLAIANMIQGVVLLTRGVFFVWPLQTDEGCLVDTLFIAASTGHYVTSIFYVYLDLYLSLNKMSVTKPVISTRAAIGLCVGSGVAWIGLGTVGYAFVNPDWSFDHERGCEFGTGEHTTPYIALVLGTFLVIFIMILVCHAMTLRLLKRSQSELKERQDESRRQDDVTSNLAAPATVTSISVATAGSDSVQKTMKRQSQWLQRNESVIRMMFIILILFMVCWYPIILLLFIQNLKPSLIGVIPNSVLYAAKCLLAGQFVGNGIIYIVKVKEFKSAVRKLCSCCLPKSTKVAAETTFLEKSANSVV